MASQAHLHRESKILPINDVLRSQSHNFLLHSFQPGHPSHSIVQLGSGERSKKHTLQSCLKDEIVPFLRNGILLPTNYRTALIELHTKTVETALGTFSINKVLGRCPPEVDVTEKYVPRAIRTTLSQLRSGHCCVLNSYRHRIGSVDDPNCPECLREEQSVQHLFNCSSHPTDLTVNSLWSAPIESATFLSSLPFFDYLPPIVRPPPEPPPLRPE